MMEKISLDKAKEIAKKKKLKPARIRGTEVLQFTKGSNAKFDVVDWDEFEQMLKKHKASVYESGGWMKIMKK